MKHVLLFLVLLCLSVTAFAQLTVVGVEANGSDQATVMAYEWRKKNVYDGYYTQAGFKVILISQASHAKVEEILNANDVTHITGCGHGNPTTYTGYGMSAVLSASDAIMMQKLAGKHVHLLSCMTAQVLGQSIVTNGAASYAGYYPNFYFTYKSFNHFMEADAVIDLGLAQGKKAPGTYADTIAKFNEKIKLLEQSEPGAIRYLVTDRDGLRCWVPEGSAMQTDKTPLPATIVSQALVARDSATGEFLTCDEYSKHRGRSERFSRMDEATFKNLVVAAYEKEPRDFEVGVISKGIFHRDQLIAEIKSESELGKDLIEVEKRFLKTATSSWWEEVVTVQTDAKGAVKKSGTFTSPTDLLRSIQIRWRGQPDTIQAKITVNGREFWSKPALSYEEYYVYEMLVQGENTYSFEFEGAPADTEVEMIFANCG